MKQTIFLVIYLFSIHTFGQKKLEILETNIPKDKFNSYADSYLWTKNWWLLNKKFIDTSRGGNAIATNSKLTKEIIDSLGKEFSKYASNDILFHGKIVPKINFVSSAKSISYIRSSIYLIEGNTAKLIVQFQIEFSKKIHNSMNDVFSLIIFNPKNSTSYSFDKVNSLYNRKTTSQENYITPPMVID